MRVMPANSTGWFWHSLARETGMLGHLFSPKAQRGPWPWFPYALDNGAFSFWDMKRNAFDFERWDRDGLAAWHQLVDWATANTQKALWGIVPDVPGDWGATMDRWDVYAPVLKAAGIPLAVAVQDGAESIDVLRLDPMPQIIAIGGTTDWKWQTVERWSADFPRVHLLRCNSPAKLLYLEKLGVESCDGTGWSRGDKAQTSGLETFCRKHGKPVTSPLWPHVCRNPVRGTGQGELL